MTGLINKYKSKIVGEDTADIDGDRFSRHSLSRLRYSFKPLLIKNGLCRQLFYARPLEIYEGAELTLDDLKTELGLLGYSFCYANN